MSERRLRQGCVGPATTRRRLRDAGPSSLGSCGREVRGARAGLAIEHADRLLIDLHLARQLPLQRGGGVERRVVAVDVAGRQHPPPHQRLWLKGRPEEGWQFLGQQLEGEQQLLGDAHHDRLPDGRDRPVHGARVLVGRAVVRDLLARLVVPAQELALQARLALKLRAERRPPHGAVAAAGPVLAKSFCVALVHHGMTLNELQAAQLSRPKKYSDAARARGSRRMVNDATRLWMCDGTLHSSRLRW